MVGRLIQKQKIRLPVNQLAQPHLGLLSSGQHPNLAFDVLRSQSALGQGRADLVLGIGWEFLPDLLDTGGGIAGSHLLLKVSDFQVISQHRLARQGRNQPQNTL